MTCWSLLSLAGRGRHYYFRYPKGVNVGNRRNLAGCGGVDVMAGWYVAAPPSVHASGRLYEWAGDTERLADLPPRWIELLATPAARVFPTGVTNVTRQKDFLRAGLARREAMTDANGQPLMTGAGKRRRPKTRIVTTDADGKVIDLHALRSVLATNLARVGVTPQVAQRIMRHHDYRTTLRHYTGLTLADSAAAIGRITLPEQDARSVAAVAGDAGVSPITPTVGARFGATRFDSPRDEKSSPSRLGER
jgi:hypothetical protein